MNAAGTLPRRIGVARGAGGPELVADYGGRVVSLTAALGWDHCSTLSLIRRWDELAPRLEEVGASAPALDPAELAWDPPVMPHKLICVGANYTDHVEEMERAGAPKVEGVKFPFSFLKPPHTALVGSDAPVAIPGFGDKLDWECELAVVIGRPELARTDPLGAIFGYAVLNDLSMRDFVAPFPHPLGLDAVIGKGWDGAAPMGPWITLAGAAGDPTSMPITLKVNGEVKQRSSTEKMVFSVAELVAYYGRVLTLEVGDVIATGTPAGVGAGARPPQFLHPGDVIEAEIGNLGTLRTPIVAPVEPISLDIH
ncbi:MAG TPA: fumarylacetoacetate hydrolase family protein [Solirubrobacterales bacterium]|nr:fumarylacetoacetate hydrolase family protein [Solirubrobacterales bacterium]